MNLKIYSKQDFPTYLPKLSALYDDLFSGGKGFRAKLIHLFAKSLNLTEQDELLLAQTIEFIHNASLLHDDLVDRSPLRRGKTAAWLRYTPEYAVLAGDYLLARVMVNLSSRGNIELVQYTAQVISDLLEGEWIQDSLVGDFGVQMADLNKVHNLKTASLFKWCLRAPFILLNENQSELHSVLEEMGSLLGMLFQRSDDLLDFDVRNHEAKALLGDLKSGYVNSFACFLFADLEEKARAKLIKAESLGHFLSLFGESLFKEKCHEFDQINQGLMLRYHQLCDILQKETKAIQPELMEQLRQLPSLLYFRAP